MHSKGHKSNKIWVDQGGEFYNNLFKRFLKVKKIDMYIMHNERKSVVAEIFIKTLINKLFKHRTAVSKNIYFDGLDDIVNKYNNTVYRIIKMKPVDVTSDSYAGYNENSKGNNPKFKVGHCVRILKYYFIISKIKSTVPWTYAICDLNGEKSCWNIL